jgi:hypothetical protein
VANPIAEAVASFWNIHPILTVFLGLVFFPEIEVIVGLLMVVFALLAK